MPSLDCAMTVNKKLLRRQACQVLSVGDQWSEGRGRSWFQGHPHAFSSLPPVEKYPGHGTGPGRDCPLLVGRHGSRTKVYNPADQPSLCCLVGLSVPRFCPGPAYRISGLSRGGHSSAWLPPCHAARVAVEPSARQQECKPGDDGRRLRAVGDTATSGRRSMPFLRTTTCGVSGWMS